MKNNSNYIDENDISGDIWKKMISGDISSFELIISKYYKDLIRYGYRILRNMDDAKDCVQNLFTYLWTSRERIKEVRNPKGYLFVSFRREALHRLAQRDQYQDYESFPESKMGISEPFEMAIIEEADMSERKAKLITKINSLSPRQKEIIYLHFYQGMDSREISEILNIRIQSVYNLLHEALNALKGRLENENIL